jgi:hypothetical protein
MAAPNPSIRDRSLGDMPKSTRLIDWLIEQQDDPDGYRSQIIEACTDPLCTYRAIAAVLSDDGPGAVVVPDRVRKWWRIQPEYDDREAVDGKHPRSRS